MNTVVCHKVIEQPRLSLKKKVWMLVKVTLVDHCYAEIQDRLQIFILAWRFLLVETGQSKNFYREKFLAE